MKEFCVQLKKKKIFPRDKNMQKFAFEFKNLAYVIRKAEQILLFVHSGPDGDTTGANLAIKEYLNGLGKKVAIACFDPLPQYLEPLTEEKFQHPDQLILDSYDVIIACDSVERGFNKVIPFFSKKQIIVLLDHHPDISLRGDINIIDAAYSSVCEIVYDFLIFSRARWTSKISTYLMTGILGDTGSFQHANTTTRVMQIASDLMKKGAPISKIINLMFSNKKFSTLKLWGKAFEKARINPQNGMIVSVLTKEEQENCGSGSDDISYVAGILNTVPGTKFALILSERENGVIKGSLRSEEYKKIDVSEIAARFGGGGHKLASGFELKGRIREVEKGWEIV